MALYNITYPADGRDSRPKSKDSKTNLLTPDEVKNFITRNYSQYCFDAVKELVLQEYRGQGMTDEDLIQTVKSYFSPY